MCLITKHLDEIHDDNKDIIEDDVRETNVRTFVEVTDIAKIVKKNPFLVFTDENSQNRTCKECEKKNFFGFTDENSYKRQSCRISTNRNKWFEPKSF